MNSYQSLSHSKWECKYHIVFIPKYRKKALYQQLRKHLGTVFRDLAVRVDSQVEEGHICKDHVHMLISIPPKHSVAKVIGFIKGKSAIHIAKNFLNHKQNFGGQHFWARGYFVSTVGRDEKTIIDYIQNQEKEDKKLDQGNLFNL
jgi:putative transposase